jgi:hypothetical protein
MIIAKERETKFRVVVDAGLSRLNLDIVIILKEFSKAKFECDTQKEEKDKLFIC